MAKIKLTKNEHKQQKDALKMYNRYLPTLQLKKQQLQMEIKKIEDLYKETADLFLKKKREIEEWVALFGDDLQLTEPMVTVKQVGLSYGNIAGVDIPLYQSVTTKWADYDLFSAPLWLDDGCQALEELLTINIKKNILKEQIKRLENELRVTSQRVNLFEKVMIPETKANIKKIEIYLGDQQTASVVRGKISKRNLLKVS